MVALPSGFRVGAFVMAETREPRRVGGVAEEMSSAFLLPTPILDTAGPGADQSWRARQEWLS
ncbi:MAG: hypothetical protein ACXVCO_13020, partial [Ktedonobacterales bacterium]